jgi:hypothetical protein
MLDRVTGVILIMERLASGAQCRRRGWFGLDVSIEFKRLDGRVVKSECTRNRFEVVQKGVVTWI